MIRRPPRSTQSRSSAASDVYKRQRFSIRLQHCASWMLDTQVKHLPNSAPLALMLFQHVARDGFRGNPITGTVVAGSRESRSSSLLPSSGSFRSRSFFCLLPPLQRPSFLLLVFLLTPALKPKNERSASDQVLNWLPGIVLFTIPCLLYTSPSPRDQRGSRMPSSA